MERNSRATFFSVSRRAIFWKGCSPPKRVGAYSRNDLAGAAADAARQETGRTGILSLEGCRTREPSQDMRFTGVLGRASDFVRSAEEHRKWLADQGLVSSVPARLTSALAALAPLLSSALSSTIAKAFTAGVG